MKHNACISQRRDYRSLISRALRLQESINGERGRFFKTLRAQLDGFISRVSDDKRGGFQFDPSDEDRLDRIASAIKNERMACRLKNRWEKEDKAYFGRKEKLARRKLQEERGAMIAELDPTKADRRFQAIVGTAAEVQAFAAAI